MAPRRGELKDRVRFERRQENGDDGYGNVSEAWSVLIASREVKIEPKRGGEAVQAARLAGAGLFSIWVDYDSQTLRVRPGDRIVDARDEARIWNIRWGPEDMDGAQQWLLLEAEQGVAT